MPAPVIVMVGIGLVVNGCPNTAVVAALVAVIVLAPARFAVTVTVNVFAISASTGVYSATVLIGLVTPERFHEYVKAVPSGQMPVDAFSAVPTCAVPVMEKVPAATVAVVVLCTSVGR